MKVNLFAHHVEGSVHVSGGGGNAEGNICKRGHAILQHDMPSQIRNHRRGFVVIVRDFLSLFLVVDLLALSTLAEIVHFFLSFRFCEAAVIDSEIANQYHLLFKRAPFRWNDHMSSKADRPRNRRSRLLDEKAKDVLNAAAANI